MPTTTRRQPPLARLAAFAAAAIAAVPAAASELDLVAALDGVIARRLNLGTALVGVHVDDAGARRTLYRSPDSEISRGVPRAMVPASNLKLLTTGAALAVLGPDFAFDTTVAVEGDRLIIVGDGDPGLGDPALLDRAEPPMTVEDLLDAVAGVIEDRGPPAIREIVIDDQIFDREWAHPSWPDDQLNRWYCAEVGGLNFHTNTLTVYFEAPSGAIGQAPSFDASPAERDARWLSIDNRARVTPNGHTGVWVARPAPANRFTLFGNIRQGRSAAVDVSVHQPPRFAGLVLADRLVSRGVAVGGSADHRSAADAVRLIGPDEFYDHKVPLVHIRTALADVLDRANVNSQNLYTEALLKRIGHAVTGERGSWANGGAVVRMLIGERLGPGHAADVRIADGSGLSRDNAVSPATIAAWLTSFANDSELREPFIASLPQPGRGTLRNRFRGEELNNEVRGKSGSLRGVRALSGYVIGARTGRTIAYSVVVNGLQRGRQEANAKDLHEQVVLAIDRWLADEEDAAIREAAAEAEGDEAIGG